MEDIYAEMMAVSRDIAASFPSPRFYSCCGEWIELSRSLFSRDEQSPDLPGLRSAGFER